MEFPLGSLAKQPWSGKRQGSRIVPLRSYPKGGTKKQPSARLISPKSRVGLLKIGVGGPPAVPDQPFSFDRPTAPNRNPHKQRDPLNSNRTPPFDKYVFLQGSSVALGFSNQKEPHPHACQGHNSRRP